MPKKLVLLLALVAFLFQVTAAQESPIYKWASKVMGSSCYLGSNNSQLTKSDGAGNAYILGSFCQPFDADPGTAVFTLTADNSNYDDSFLIKLDPQGNFLWATRFAEAPYFNFASALTIDANGNVYTVTSYQISASDYRTVVSKFDASGNAIWSDRFHTIQSYGQAIVLDASGNPILTGGFSGTVDFDPGAGVQSVTSNGGADLFILKLDIDGNFLWVQTTGGTGGEGGRSLALDASGNIIVAGIYSGTTDLNPGAAVNSFTAAGSLDIFILKLDATGNYIWAKSIGNTNNDYSTSVAVNTSGAVFLTGYFLGSVDFDPDAGVTTLTSGVYTDIFLMRLNANGSFGWAYSFGGSDNDEGRSITTDVGGNLIFSGFFNGTVDFDPGAGVRNLVSIGQTNYQNMFIAKLNESGQLIWAQEIASTTQTSSTVRGYTISTDTTGDILLGGTAGGTTDFDFGICNRTLGNNPPVGFVMKIKTGSAPGPPVITSFSPTSGVTGDTVVITGTNFSSDPSENIVRWNPSRTAVVIASTDTTITARIPTGASTGKISVTVSCYPIALSSTNFTVGAALLPTITSFTPSSGLVGTTVTITGTNFSTTTTSNTVTFNGTAAVVTASTTTSITTSVPSGATTGKIAVTVGGNTATSTSDFTVTTSLPTISSFNPSAGPEGTTVTITGTNFSAVAANNAVTFNGMAAVVTSSTTTSITTSVPSGATTGKIAVTVGGNTATSTTDFTVTTSLPTISSFNPSTGPEGTTVTITGTNFSAVAANNAVTFNGTAAVVTASTTTSITTSVPSGATTGKIAVTVGGNTATSTSDFTVIIKTTIEIVPQALTAVIEGKLLLDLEPIISVTNGSLDQVSLTIATPPQSGATAFITDKLLTVDYKGTSFSGTDVLTISACHTSGSCALQDFNIEVVGNIVVFNGISPGGANPKFIIQYIDVLPDTKTNSVYIFDRWENLVWHGTNYDNQSVVFSGSGDSGNALPSGVYFYKIDFASGRKTQTGFLSLRRQ